MPEANSVTPIEFHPSFRPRIARALRFGRKLKGWRRVVNFIAGEPTKTSFTVRNSTGWFSGSLDSLIERQVYLFGGYEEDMIATFRRLFPRPRRRCLVDVGANVGTHSLAFARFFDNVVSFEPNFQIYESLKRNLSLNPNANVTALNYGLGDSNECRDFFGVHNGNAGLGTFLDKEQYDQPLKKIGEFQIRRGDDVLPTLIGRDERIDAIKLDIQGFEPLALRGMRSILSCHRPIVWVEVGNGTNLVLNEAASFASLFPYPVRAFAFRTSSVLLRATTSLMPIASTDETRGNIVVCPEELTLPSGFL